MEPTLPSGVTTAFSTIEGQVGAMIDAGWPIIIAAVGGFIVIKLFKRVAGKI